MTHHSHITASDLSLHTLGTYATYLALSDILHAAIALAYIIGLLLLVWSILNLRMARVLKHVSDKQSSDDKPWTFTDEYADSVLSHCQYCDSPEHVTSNCPHSTRPSLDTLDDDNNVPRDIDKSYHTPVSDKDLDSPSLMTRIWYPSDL